MYRRDGIVGFERHVEEVKEKLGGDLIRHVLTRWSQGKFLDLSLEEAEPLLVKPRETKRLVGEAAEKLEEFLNSRWSGVEFFTIVSPSRFYGTGKSQIAYFVKEELERRGYSAAFISLEPGDVKKERVTLSLLRFNAEGKKAVFIDEVDLLVSPTLPPEEQARLIEAFANQVIGYAEKYSRITRQAVVFILSKRAEEEINRVSSSRLGRRLRNTLATVSFELDREDAYRIFANAAIVSALAEGLLEEAPEWVTRFLYLYARDYADYYWDDRLLSSLPLGDALSRAVYISRALSSALKNYIGSNGLNPLIGAENPVMVGRAVESGFKQAAEKLFSRFVFEIETGGEKYKVEVLLNPSPRRVGQWKADMSYAFTLGGEEIGYTLVEVTSEATLSQRKRLQLQGFASSAYTILVYLYTVQSSLDRLREELETIEARYPLELIGIPLPIAKYPSLLDLHGVEPLVRALETLEISERVRALLYAYSKSLLHRWIAAKESAMAAEASGAEAEERISRALTSVAAGFTAMLEFSGKRKRRSWDKMKTFLRSSLEDVLESIGIEVDDGLVETVLESILQTWQSKGLGHITKSKSFSKDEKRWNDAEATAAAAAVLKEVMGVSPTTPPTY